MKQECSIKSKFVYETSKPRHCGPAEPQTNQHQIRLAGLGDWRQGQKLTAYNQLIYFRYFYIILTVVGNLWLHKQE